MSIIADTDILIDFLAGRDPAASRIAIELRSGALRTTTITRFDLLAGARTARQRATILELLDAIPAPALDTEAADLAADVRRALERAGTSIGMGDSLIAGIVLLRPRGISLCRTSREVVSRGSRTLPPRHAQAWPNRTQVPENLLNTGRRAVVDVGRPSVASVQQTPLAEVGLVFVSANLCRLGVAFPATRSSQRHPTGFRARDLAAFRFRIAE